MKYYIALCGLLSSGFLFAQQSVETQLDSLTSEETAVTYIKENSHLKGKILTFNEAKHKSSLARELLEKGVGGKLTTGNDYEKVYYKVMEVYHQTHYRASIIYFDTQKMQPAEVKALQNKIVTKYQEGKPFSFLAKQYSMHHTAKQGGDLGWFTEGTYDPFLENEILVHASQTDALFTAQNGNSYYIILITHSPLEIKELKVLKIVEPIN